jgi:Helicase associated domain
VPQRYKTEEGYRLGQWVNMQRANKKGLDPSRRQRLEALSGWDWNPVATQWEEGFSRLKLFSEQQGHCVVMRDHKTEDGYRLGKWVNRQRIHKDSMQPDRRRRLEALAGWSWEPRFDLWEMGFSKLKHFSDREGHCRVPKSYVTEEGYRLGRWVGVQRNNKIRLDSHHQERLEALPGWTWKVRWIDKTEE